MSSALGTRIAARLVKKGVKSAGRLNTGLYTHPCSTTKNATLQTFAITIDVFFEIKFNSLPKLHHNSVNRLGDKVEASRSHWCGSRI
jgi:hypothetical protein